MMPQCLPVRRKNMKKDGLPKTVPPAFKACDTLSITWFPNRAGKKMSSSHPGEVDFPVGQVTSQS